MQSNGVLLLAVEDSSLYAMVDVFNSKLRYSYNMGYGNSSVVFDVIVNDGKTHKVKLTETGPDLEKFDFEIDGKKVAKDQWFHKGEPYITPVAAEYVYFGGAEKYPKLPAGM